MSSGFISEVEIAAAKQKRQDEWEQIRQPDEPLELPEEPHDSRSLYERLKVQKDQKDMEFEESRKLKNLIRGLVEDEVDFLETVDKSQLMAKQKQEQEEHSELQDYRKKVAALNEKSQLAMPSIITGTSRSSSNSISNKSATILQGSTAKRLNQKSILAGVIKRKCDGPTSPTKTTTTITDPMKVISESNGSGGGSIDSIIDTRDKNRLASKESSKNTSINEQQESMNLNKPTTIQSTAAKRPSTVLYCIGILPSYCRSPTSSSRSTSQDSSDDSDDSTDIEDVPMSMPIPSAAATADDEKCEKTKPKYFFS